MWLLKVKNWQMDPIVIGFASRPIYLANSSNG